MKEKILDALRQVDDPDLKKDIVTLGMVQDLTIEGNKVHFKLVLTTPACPLKDVIKNACVTAIHMMVDNNLQVEIEFGSVVTSQHKAQEGGLAHVKNIIAVASGKGGVGKSTVSTNLAIALSQLGSKVGLLDADIYGPSLPTMLGLKGQPPVIKEENGKQLIQPYEKYGIKAMSVGLLINEKQALVWRGPMISTALKQLLVDVAWGELDYLVVDLPPGTGDIHLTLSQQFQLSGVVIVTTPQQVSVADTRKSIEMFRLPAINAPILGIVENMSYFTPDEAPGVKYHLFGKGGGEELASQYGVPMLGELPLIHGLADQADKGVPAMLQENSLLQTDYVHIAEKVAQMISIINAKGPKQELAEEAR
jgi:ATP-binding protein involved in chromosome partitioning